jgi:hypothetical protein
MIRIYTVNALIFAVFLFSLFSSSVRNCEKQYWSKTLHKYEPTQDWKTQKQRSVKFNYQEMFFFMYMSLYKIRIPKKKQLS